MTAYSTNEVIDQMRKAGLDVTRGYVDFLFRERHLEKPDSVGRTLIWREENIAALREWLESRGRLLPDETTA